MSALTDVQILNEALFDQLGTPGMEKNAQDAVTEFTRVRVRSAGIYRKVLPAVTVTNADLTRQVDTPKPVIVVDKEPGSPGAITIPFGTLPMGWYIRAPRYRVMFARIASPKFMADVDELRTYNMDIRQILSDNAIKDMLEQEDSNFLGAVDTALGGAADAVVTSTGVVQWETIFGGISRDTVEEAMTIMPKTPGHWEVATVLVNNVTIHQILKWGYDEAGGDTSGEFLRKGWTELDLMGRKWIVTIERTLVPYDSMYFFGDPRAIGKSFLLEDTVMHIKREAFMIEFFAYETLGGAIGNVSALARADFA